MPSNALEISKLEDSAAGRALQATAQAPTENFVKFTNTLISGVFDTLVQFEMQQTHIYTEMVASVAGTVQDFEAKTIGNVDEAAVKYLTDVVLPTYEGTAAPPLPTPPFATAPTISGTTTFIKPEVAQIYGGVTATISGSEKTFALDTSNVIPTDELFEFTKELLRKKARGTYEELKALVAAGMDGIEITEGSLETKMTFHTEATDSASLDSTNTRTDFQNRSRTFAGNLSRSATNTFGGNIAKFHFGRAVTNTLAGSYNDNSYSSSLNVNVVNEKKTAVTNLRTDISGGMLLRFRMKRFPGVTG